MEDKVYHRDFSSELNFSASKSSGPGGQNVNKVNSKVTLRFNIDASSILSAEEKDKLKRKLPNKINNENELVINSESERSQLKNKEETIKKFYESLKEAFKQRKKRKSTKPSKASVQKRLKEKKIRGEKKQTRQKYEL